MRRRIKFEKTQNCWFAVIPEWEGPHGDLQMVAGADNFLDILCEGEWDVWLTLSTEPMGENRLDLIEETPDSGGGNYLLKKYLGIEMNHKMWLCYVTEFVFGSMPKTIWFAVG